MRERKRDLVIRKIVYYTRVFDKTFKVVFTN